MAEGLIPFVYRAIERRKSSRRYQSLSPSDSAAAGAAAAAIVAAARIPEDQPVTDFGGGYDRDNQYRHQPQRMSADGLWAPSTLELGGDGYQRQNSHRKWATVDDYAFEEYRRQQHQPPLAKARSSRMFSCITGM